MLTSFAGEAVMISWVKYFEISGVSGPFPLFTFYWLLLASWSMVCLRLSMIRFAEAIAVSIAI